MKMLGQLWRQIFRAKVKAKAKVTVTQTGIQQELNRYKHDAESSCSL
jgi:hypothetical protein